MKYFFVLGNHPLLSLAELISFFGLKGKEPAAIKFCQPEICILDLEIDEEEAAAAIKTLGGTIKVGRIIQAEVKIQPNLAEEIGQAIQANTAKTGKLFFGFSLYGQKSALDLKKLGLETKKVLKEKGLSARFVVSRDKNLSSVVVETNKLTGKNGAEIVFINQGQTYSFGRTLAVQPFRELSQRDYGRPGRDDHSGMLPPKLAQIMINLAGKPTKGSCLLDPFCGSGTVLTEAALAGFKQLIGTDISERAVRDTGKNLKWISFNYESASSADKLKITNYELKKVDVRRLSSVLKGVKVDLIVTEPYLGPQRGLVDTDQVVGELNALYSEALREFGRILRPGGRAVMVWPVFQAGRQSRSLAPKLNGLQITSPVPAGWQKLDPARLTARGTLIYGRSGQKVWREIVVLTKSS